MIPSDISGLQFWVKADQIPALVDGDPISTWSDQSGNGRDLTATGVPRPTYNTAIVNGKPIARFDGVTNVMTGSSSVTGTGARTVFIVMKSATTSITGMFGLNTEAVPANGADWIMSPDISIRVNGGNRVFTVNTGTTAFHVLTMSHAAAANVTAVSAWMDGTALTQSSTTALAINTGTAGQTLGDTLDQAIWSGDVAEVIVYNTELSAGNRAGIHSYIQDKYAITVSDYVPSATAINTQWSGVWRRIG